MTRPADTPFPLPKLLLRASGAALVGIAVIGLTGQLLGSPRIAGLYLRTHPLPSSSAFAFVLMGAGFLGLSAARRPLSRVCAAAVALVALSELARHFTHRLPDLDDIVARLAVGEPISVDMASGTAVSFLLAAGSLHAMTAGRRHARMLAVTGGLLLGVVLLVLLGFLSGFRPASSWTNFTGMSLPSAIGLAVVALTAVAWTWREPARQSPSIPLGAAAAVIMFCVGIISLRSTDALADANDWVRHTFEVRDSLEQILIDLNTADDNRRLFNQSADERMAAAFRAAGAESLGDVEDAIRLVSDDEAQEAMAVQLRGLVRAKLAQGARVIEERRHRVTTLDQRSRHALEAYDLMRPVQRIVDGMLSVEQGLLLKRTAETRRVAEQTRALLLLGSTVAAALVAAAVSLALLSERARRRAEADLMLVNSQLRTATAAAQESTRMKAQFLANMSHEIRTPMNGVVGMVSLLLDTELSPEQRLLTGTIRSSADVLLGLLNDILDLSKIEAGQLIMEASPFDLRGTVEDSIGILAGRADSKGIELACRIGEDVPPRVVGDQGRLQQVLLNLVGNAVKFTDRGEVVVSVGRVPDARGPAVLRFEVRDTGIGIDPGIGERLFQPFVQADGGTTRLYGGTGLGLAICRQLVQLMGGAIGFDSVPGSGSTFWFTAPFGEQPPSAKAAAEPALAGARVLVVDDNQSVRGIIAGRCAAWGMEAVQAAGGGEALGALRAAAAAGTRFGVVIADMQMPSMSGLALARSIRGDPALSGTRIVLLSSLGSPVDQRELEEAGVCARIAKPARDAQLREAVAACLRGDGAAGPGPSRRAPAAAAPGGLRLRVLVAEDNIVNQQVAALQLARLGHLPHVVGSGGEAVEAVQAGPYDLVLMDCQMPGMDGYEATRRIRRWEDERRARGERFVPVHVIAMTANAMLGDRDACFSAGMNDYVAKPITVADLAAALARIAAATA